MGVTVDFAAKLIRLTTTGTYDVRADIYSGWKDAVLAAVANLKYEPAFRSTGGNDIGNSQRIGYYYELRNDLGWRIELPPADGTVTINGNLFGTTSGTALFQNNAGSYNHTVQQSTSANATVVVVSGASVLTTEQANQLSTAATNATAAAADASTAAAMSNVIDGGLTAAQLLKVLLAVSAGKLAISGNTVTIRDQADAADVITATTDADGQRTAVTVNP